MNGPTQPRISPLPHDERDDFAKQLLEQANGGTTLDLNIFATLVRHPKLFQKWSPFAFKIMSRGEVPAKDREVLILRTAWHCRNAYEWGQHEVFGLRDGLTQKEIDLLMSDRFEPELDPWLQVLVDAADELAKHKVISGLTWSRLAEKYNEEQMIEVSFIVGQYTMLAYAMNSMGVQVDESGNGFA